MQSYKTGPKRASTIANIRYSTVALKIGKLLYPERVQHPQCRGQCPDVRPCPYVGCRWNLYLDVTPTGSITYNWPELEPWDVPPHQSCALDVADDGPRILEEIAEIMGLTRERVRQIEGIALGKLEATDRTDLILQWCSSEPSLVREYARVNEDDHPSRWKLIPVQITPNPGYMRAVPTL